MKQIEMEATPFPLFFGLGYPRGHRSRNMELYLFVDKKVYELQIMTSTFHRREVHLFGGKPCDASCPWFDCPFNQFFHEDINVFQAEQFRFQVRGAYSIYIDAAEFTYEDVEHMVQELMKILYPRIVTRIVWPPTFKEKDEAKWRESFVKWIEWLKQGAPVSYYDQYVPPEYLSCLSSEDRSEAEKVLITNGFTKDEEDGSFHKKKGEKPRDTAAEVVERRLLRTAKEAGEEGVVYLSPGSWPPLDGVVADGTRYAVSLAKEGGKRYWVGYFQGKKWLVFIDAQSGVQTVLKVEADPEVLLAMNLVYQP